MADTQMTLRQAADWFLSRGRAHWSQQSSLYYDRTISYFVQFAETFSGRPADQTPLNSLPRDILVQYVLWLRSKDRYSGHPSRPYMQVEGTISTATLHSYTRAAKSFFNSLYAEGITDTRYTAGVKLPCMGADQVVPLLADEAAAVDAMFSREEPMDLRNLCIFHLMLDAGLRSLEVRQLMVKDLMFPSHSIIINRSKGMKSRAVIMCPRLQELLEHYIELVHPSSFLFEAKGGGPITPSVLRSLFLKIRRKTGIERLHPHLLRHTFATSYIMGGGNLEMLRILLGHYDYTVTRQYLHFAVQYQILDFPIYRLDPVFFKRGY